MGLEVYTPTGLALSLHEFVPLKEIAAAIQSQTGSRVLVEQLANPSGREKGEETSGRDFN